MSRAARGELEGLPVTVMGLGLFGGGAAVARWLARRGARVTVTDVRGAAELAPALRALEGLPLRLALGGHREEDFARAALVVANPAVKPGNRYLALARAAGVPVTSEMALFLERCPARIALVTGTQGKSTSCSVLAQLLRAAGFTAHLGGNIGRSLLEEAGEMRPDDVAVVEISSYQLEVLPGTLGAPGAPPRIEAVAVTNVLADHLDRHGTMEAYAAAKRRILEPARAAGGVALLNAEDPRIAAWRDDGLRRVEFFPRSPGGRGLHIAEGCFRLEGETLGRVGDLRLPGAFQRENVLVSLGLARLLGAGPARLAAAIGGLEGLPHRMEDLGLRRGRRVTDNGVSTTPDSTVAALLSASEGCTLVCGGQDKGLPLEELARTARARSCRVVAFGAGADRLAAAFTAENVEVRAAAGIGEAVALAFDHTPEGGEILLSPACASFDAFLNFRERARAFREALPPLDPRPGAR